MTVKYINNLRKHGLEKVSSVHKYLQRICDHFQAILNILKRVEDLVSSVPRDEVDSSTEEKKKKVAVVTLLPKAEGLKETMNKSREILCKHVRDQAALLKQLPSKDDKQQKRDQTREVRRLVCIKNLSRT